MPNRARSGRAGLVAASLADLHGPDRGVVEFPLRLFWSAPGSRLRSGPASMLQAMYEAVLREASRPDDLASYLNGEVLVAVWPELFLPEGLRRAWEGRHPALRAAPVRLRPRRRTCGMRCGTRGSSSAFLSGPPVDVVKQSRSVSDLILGGPSGWG